MGNRPSLTITNDHQHNLLTKINDRWHLIRPQDKKEFRNMWWADTFNVKFRCNKCDKECCVNTQAGSQTYGGILEALSF